MWIVTTTGFFSIVRKDGDDAFVIRARVRKDLVDLKKAYLPKLGKIIETDNSDYRFRAYAKPKDVAAAVAAIVIDVDYPNFKDEVSRVQGKPRAAIYMRVWSALLALQPIRYSRKTERTEPDMVDRRWRTAFGDIGR